MLSKYQVIRTDANKSYGIYKVGSGCHRIVKNLKDYDNDKSAIDDLTRLVVGEITERDLLGPNYAQDMETGKLGNRVNVLEAALENIRDSIIKALGDGDTLEKAAREVVRYINDLVQ